MNFWRAKSWSSKTFVNFNILTLNLWIRHFQKKKLFFFLLSNYSVWRHSNVISRKKLSVARGFSLAFQLIFSTLANKQVCWQWRQFHQRHCRYLLNHKIVVIDRISIQWQYILWLVRGRYNVRLLSIFLEPLTWIFKHL